MSHWPVKMVSRWKPTLIKEETTDVGFMANSKKGKSTGNYSNEPYHETNIALKSKTAYTDITELGEKVRSMMVFSENIAAGGNHGKARICKMCGKEGQWSHIVKHIEANHITGIALPCNICGKTSSTRHALTQHKIKFHKQ